MRLSFLSIFKNLQTPVIVCANRPGWPIVFANQGAWLLLNPMLSVDRLRDKTLGSKLPEVLRLSSPDEYENLFGRVRLFGYADGYVTNVTTYEELEKPVVITANFVEEEGEEYFVLYLKELHRDESAHGHGEFLFSVFHLAYSIDDIDEAINKLLALVGSYVSVSRAYVFESISPITTSNTYEWCAEGVEPAIQDLKDLPKADYNYDVIVESGVYISDDIRDLDERDFAILDAQGIKSLAILPLYHADRPLGYVGFDDCEKYRRWSSFEITLLKDICLILVSLLVRRNLNQKVLRTSSILQLITDNIDNPIYVSDPTTHELIFVNKQLAELTDGRSPDSLLGEKCWQVLQKDLARPCSFCPLRQMRTPGGEHMLENYSWEFKSPHNDHWYNVRDSFIEWEDGRQVHLATLNEITAQKEYEEQLKHYASVDSMTGVYNREWGSRRVSELLAQSVQPAVSLVFIDLDGLKHVNDSFGHSAGDQMILQTLDVIRKGIRQSDSICRWGGDEFILLLLCNKTSAERVVLNIQAEMERINQSGHNLFDLAFSYGITELGNQFITSIDGLISHADNLMYQQKMSKRAD